MITLHEAYEQGSDDVKAAIQAFGASHPSTVPTPGATPPEPDWKTAEKHFTQLTEVIMGAAIPEQPDRPSIVRRAEQEAVAFLLAVTQQTNFRCPICVMRYRSPQ
ncbi:hypothetical protein [Streptomyces justiciae]|uniref:hypothetical protein n=1 Tax=Streptomyces justiciae TaxID=2780140 RepID=UPI002117B029|nr:hypothetical protein [Streptomyces justiciae]MCW8382433.1 hypothetical protein [Streptomyces justiciae]